MDPWPALAMCRSFIIASRGLRERQIGSSGVAEPEGAVVVGRGCYSSPSRSMFIITDKLTAARGMRHLVVGDVWLYPRLSPLSQCQRKRFNR